MFGIDIETCRACGGAVRFIACIEDPEVIEKILIHLDAKAAEREAPRWPLAGWEGERAQSAPANPSSGWLRAPWRHSKAIGERRRPPTAGADTGVETLPAAEKVVYPDYTPTIEC